MQRDPITYEWPPLRTDSISIGTLQLASKMAAQKAADAFPDLRCAMWAQLDAEIGILFRGILLSAPELKRAKGERVRYDDLKDDASAEQIIAGALDRLAKQLST